MINSYFCSVERGLVIKSTGSWYQVKSESNEMIECRIKGKFRLKGIDTTNPIAVGDYVTFELVEDGTGVINAIEPRKNYIIRKSVNLSKKAHIIASNIDQAFLIVTLKNPQTYPSFIDRFLVSAEAYDIPVILLFNKIDLLDDEENKELDELINIYENIGYECLKISVKENENIQSIKDLFKDKASVIGGHSGVGKSSLINALDPNLDIRVGEISDSHKQGKHTTTFAEMHALDFGGYIIDTPGIRGLGLVDIEKENLSHYYPEMAARMHDCKFNNCVHINEPKCAIKEAVEEEEIAVSRYNTYLSLYQEDEEENYRENIYGPK